IINLPPDASESTIRSAARPTNSAFESKNFSLVSIDSRAIFRILSFVTRPQFMDEGWKLQAEYLFRFFAAGSAIEYRPQCLARVGSPDSSYFFGCALSHDPAAFFAALRPQVDDPVRALNNVQVMFDYYYGIAERNKLM